MEEKFSVGLELVVDKFKSRIEDVKKSIKSVGQVAKNDIVMDIETPKFDKKLEQDLLQQKNKIIESMGYLKEALAQMTPYQDKSFIEDGLERDRQKLEEINQKLREMQEGLIKTTQTSSSFSKAGDKISNTLSKIQDGMKKSLKSAKRFTLSLFGIQSVYRMLSRASSAYLAQDQETSDKIQAAWIGLGSVFAPLLQTIADFAIKAVKYINVFIKALTGADFLANAMAKSMNKANKSAKKLSKTLAGFDEITNLDSQDSGGGIGSNWASAFDDIDLNPNVVKKLQDLAKWLRENEELIKAVGIALGVTFGVVAISKILGGIGSLIGSATLGTGLLGLSGILGGLATIGGIAISVYFVGKILQEAKDLREEMEKIREVGQEGYRNWVKETKDIDKIYNSMNAHRTTTEEALENTNNWLYKITGNSQTWLDTAGNIAITSQDNLDRIKELYGVEINTKEEKQKTLDVLKKQLDTLYKVREEYTMQGRDTKEIDKTISNYASTLDEISTDLGISSNYTKQMNDWMKKTDTNAGKLYKTMSKIAGLGGGSSFGGGGFGGGGLGGGGRIPGYDVGTNYVPQDTLALIHKGEAVIPKKFNSATYFSGNSEQTNALLAELINRVEQIEINPYTTIKDVGTASVDYINKQNRIMGRGVI